MSPSSFVDDNFCDEFSEVRFFSLQDSFDVDDDDDDDDGGGGLFVIIRGGTFSLFDEDVSSLIFIFIFEFLKFGNFQIFQFW